MERHNRVKATFLTAYGITRSLDGHKKRLYGLAVAPQIQDSPYKIDLSKL